MTSAWSLDEPPTASPLSFQMHTYVANALFHKGNWDVILGNGQQISGFL